jgi:chloramphenicol-sensitive protein RarD
METGGARAKRVGTIAAFVTYALWGVFPLYWKRLAGVDAVQILCHRIIWAAVFTLFVLAVQGKLGGLATLARDGRKLRAVLASAALITVNWGIYIWAVNAGRVTESSLGYYINPLLSVALGAIFLGERLDRWTARAVATAAAGIAAASILLGSLPWVSLVLASSFALYGLVKKVTALDPMTGLAAETLAATPFALAWLAREHLAGRGSFGGGRTRPRRPCSSSQE